MTVRTTSLCLLSILVFLAFLTVPYGHWAVRAASLPQVGGVRATPVTEVVSTALPYVVYLPFIEKNTWVDAPLVNGGFEAAWDTESSRQAVAIDTDTGAVTQATYGNILTPPGWLTWFRQGVAYPDEGVRWGQPEVRSVRHHNPDRMHSGTQGTLLFTFWRVHDAGFLQHVDVITGQQVRLTGWAHAWSNNAGAPTPDNPDDPFWSEGSQVGFNHFSAPEGSEGLDGGDQNFTFMLGIDPAGGENPFAETVVWGPGMHIYNGFKEVPAVTTRARGSSITVFLRSRTLWRYKHNDAYWDDITLQVMQ